MFDGQDQEQKPGLMFHYTGGSESGTRCDVTAVMFLEIVLLIAAC